MSYHFPVYHDHPPDATPGSSRRTAILSATVIPEAMRGPRSEVPAPEFAHSVVTGPRRDRHFGEGRILPTRAHPTRTVRHEHVHGVPALAERVDHGTFRAHTHPRTADFVNKKSGRRALPLLVQVFHEFGEQRRTDEIEKTLDDASCRLDHLDRGRACGLVQLQVVVRPGARDIWDRQAEDIFLALIEVHTIVHVGERLGHRAEDAQSDIALLAQQPRDGHTLNSTPHPEATHPG